MGGALVELGGWRWAFLVNLPFGVLALVATRRTVVESRAPGRRMLPDIPGALLLAARPGPAQPRRVQGNDWGWGSPRVLGSFALAALLGAAFVRSSLRHRAPVVDPALRAPPVVPQRRRGHDPGRAGLLRLPADQHPVAPVRLGVRRAARRSRTGAGRARGRGGGGPARAGRRAGRLPRPGRAGSAGVGRRVPLVPPAGRAGARPSGRSGCPARCCRGSGSARRCRCSAAPPSPPSPVAATRRRRPWSPARGSSAACWASRSWSSSSATRPAPASWTSLRDGWLLSIVAFVLVALVAVPLGKVVARQEAEDVDHGAPLLLLPDAGATPWSRAPAEVLGRAGRHPTGGRPVGQRPRGPGGREPHGHVDAGDWLFRQDDPPGSAYLLRSGRLEVVKGGRLVRTLTPGAVVGELALLTGEPRSAGIRARRDASLIEMPRPAFDGLLDRDAQATRTVLAQVASQMRTAGQPAADRAGGAAARGRRGRPARGKRKRRRRAAPAGAAGHAPLASSTRARSTPTASPGPRRRATASCSWPTGASPAPTRAGGTSASGRPTPWSSSPGRAAA